MEREPKFSDGSKKPYYFTKDGRQKWRWYVYVVAISALIIAIIKAGIDFLLSPFKH